MWLVIKVKKTRPLREARPTPRINVERGSLRGVERGSLRSKGRVGSAAHPTQTRPLREAHPTPRINVERGSLRSKGRVGSAPIRRKRALFERHPSYTYDQHTV
jgi:hypothetical protein